jgi:hypothetical protein
MTHDREGPPIPIWHKWLPSSFEEVLFFHAKYYAHMLVSRKTHVSEFFTRNSKSKNFIFDRFQISSPRTRHETFKSCSVTSASSNPPALPSNGLCAFLDRARIVVPFRVFLLLCLASVQRWVGGNTHHNNSHWKVHNFGYLVHFSTPKSICIHQTYEIQFSVVLSTYYSGYSAKHMHIEPQNNIEGYSRGFWQCTGSKFATLFRKD